MMARTLFQQALIEPTENSIAQAEWASRYLRLFDFDPRLLSQPRTYEANAWAAYTGQQWQSALEHARHWVADEPLSGRAAGMGSAVAAVALEEFHVAVAFAQQGVLANPDDLVLRNNLVFTLAEAGRLQDTVRVHEPLRRAPFHGATRVMWLANGGLLEYRAGRADTGKALYEQAVTLARDIKDIGLARIAAAYRAGEEFRTLPPKSGDDATIDGVIAELRQMPHRIYFSRSPGLSASVNALALIARK